MKASASRILITAITLAMAGCMTDGIDGIDDEEQVDENVSETASALTAAVVCTGIGEGTCTANSMPSGWTITPTNGGSVWIEPTGQTVDWVCYSLYPTRTVTATGVGTATVRCAR